MYYKRKNPTVGVLCASSLSGYSVPVKELIFADVPGEVLLKNAHAVKEHVQNCIEAGFGCNCDPSTALGQR